MEVPWRFDVDYIDFSRYVLKVFPVPMCPYFLVLLYE